MYCNRLAVQFTMKYGGSNFGLRRWATSIKPIALNPLTLSEDVVLGSHCSQESSVRLQHSYGFDIAFAWFVWYQAFCTVT